MQITYQPLRSRQPDLLFISGARLEENAPSEQYSLLAPAPELVVEIVSPADTRKVLAEKIADYQFVNVQELWIVRSEEQMVEILDLCQADAAVIGLYQSGQTAQSQIFLGLTVEIDALFQE